MAAFPTFRNKTSTRYNYTLLENTDSDIDSLRRRSISSQNGSQRTVPLLCDKCWLRHERNRATKHCLDCKQNLCSVCARADEVTRPWWIPGWMVQCWRFLFIKAYTPHSIVNLDSTEIENTHWAHTQEASHVQPIPRVKQSSLRSNKSKTSIDTNRSHQTKSRHSSLTKLKDREEYQIPEVRNQRLFHSQSFDAKAKKRQNNDLRPRRTRSSEELIKRHRSDDLERLKRYNENWELSFKLADSKEARMRQRHCSNKMLGKDVNIEITDDKEIKLSFNEKSNNSDKCSVSKSKNKKKLKGNTPRAYTEQIFEEVPIWFKKSPKHPSNERLRRKDNSQEMKKQSDVPNNNFSLKEGNKIRRKAADQQENANYHFKQTNLWPDRDSFNFSTEYVESFSEKPKRFPDSNGKTENMYTGNHNTAYIVEEPPETCPICLEDLPGTESRGLSCSHSIHTKCLISYLYKMDLDFGIRCPLCAQTTIIRNYYAPKQLWYKELPIFTTV